MRITGTFLDELTVDIASNNWSASEWDREFEIMNSVGIDTVIVIRPGNGSRALFESEVLKKHVNLLPVYDNLFETFLDLSEKYGMQLYSGTYHSGGEFITNPDREIEINKAFIEEILEKYGSRKAFAGWYLSSEIGKQNEAGVKTLRELGKVCKGRSPNDTVLISPYMWGCKQFDDPITPERHEKEWDEIFAQLEGFVDIVAFQDGNVGYDDLSTYLDINLKLLKKYGMTAWSNVETFDRDMSFNFPPINWPSLRFKMETAQKLGVEKLITFEFSHFLSPQSCWPSARNLFLRYCEHFSIETEFDIKK